jgi:acetyl-CoA acetyltransferase
VEQVLKAPVIASPFELFDCCPTTDGAAAAIVCRADWRNGSGSRRL